MNWRNQGTRLFTTAGVAVRKRYYSRRIAKYIVDFRKCVFEICGLNRILIHYRGSREEELPEAPHGNRKSDLKEHIRVMPSVLSDIKEKRVRGSAEDIYTKMVSDRKIPVASLKVALPRNMKQVENKIHYGKKHLEAEKCDVSEVLALLELDKDLGGGFIKHLSIVPSLDVVLINEQLLLELASIIRPGERCLMSCITKAKFRDMFITVLIGQHYQFDCEPGVPLAFLIHRRHVLSSYRLMLQEVKRIAPTMNSENVVFVTNLFPSVIHEAWSDILPNAPHFTCWESIKKTLAYELKKLKIPAAQKKTYFDDITCLLLSSDDKEYDNSYYNLKQSWLQDFTVVYDTKLYNEVKRSIRGALLCHRVYTQDHGVNTIVCDGLNIVARNILTCNEPSLDSMAFALYMLGCHYVKDIIRSFACKGPWWLKQEHSEARRVFSSGEEMELLIPVAAADPSDIVRLAQGKNVTRVL